MSDLGLELSGDSKPPKGARHRGRSWLAVLVSLAVVLALFLGFRFLASKFPSFGLGPPDYTGEGTNTPVTVEVAAGNTLTQIGQTLKEKDVVASVDAWLGAVQREPKSSTIGPGLYDMRTQMSADAAVERMIDPNSRITADLLLREGLRIWESADTIVKSTNMTASEVDKALKDADAIGLPSYADGFAEGFLFPATYEVSPGESATALIKRIVDRYESAAEAAGLADGAQAQGFSTYEALIIASLVQAEGHPQDFEKVARVIYNRLDPATWAGTNGYLQMDATVNYALKSSEINLTEDQLHGTDSPYNTYTNKGLPPTPINSPGQAAMEAAIHPADGPWLYYVTVNPDTGETKFTDDYQEFLQFKDELSKWHQANP